MFFVWPSRASVYRSASALTGTRVPPAGDRAPRLFPENVFRFVFCLLFQINFLCLSKSCISSSELQRWRRVQVTMCNPVPFPFPFPSYLFFIPPGSDSIRIPYGTKLSLYMSKDAEGTAGLSGQTQSKTKQTAAKRS